MVALRATFCVTRNDPEKQKDKEVRMHVRDKTLSRCCSPGYLDPIPVLGAHLIGVFGVMIGSGKN